MLIRFDVYTENLQKLYKPYRLSGAFLANPVCQRPHNSGKLQMYSVLVNGNYSSSESGTMVPLIKKHNENPFSRR